MTQEEKQLLLVDLCARLPYGVVVSKKPINESFTWQELQDFQYGKIYKPYLRPMSSMTEEEHIKLKAVYDNGSNGLFDEYSHIDWLNANHFDYRGLIERGLALEAPEDMYKTE